MSTFLDILSDKEKAKAGVRPTGAPSAMAFSFLKNSQPKEKIHFSFLNQQEDKNTVLPDVEEKSPDIFSKLPAGSFAGNFIRGTVPEKKEKSADELKLLTDTAKDEYQKSKTLYAQMTSANSRAGAYKPYSDDEIEASKAAVDALKKKFEASSLEYNNALVQQGNKKRQDTIDALTIPEEDKTLTGLERLSTPTNEMYIAKGKEENKKYFTPLTGPNENKNVYFGTQGRKAKLVEKMTQQEQDTYAYWLAKDKDKAKSFFNAIEPTLNERLNTEDSAKIKELSEEHPWLYGLPANITGSFAAPLGLAATGAQAAKNLFTGEKEVLPSSSPWFSGARMVESSAEGIKENTKTAFGDFLVDTGLSMAQFVSKLPLGAAALPIMASGAGGQAAYSALERGGTTEQALQMGLVSAAAEYFTEKISLDSLWKMYKAGGAGFKEGLKTALKNMGRQSLTEASEETLSELINNIGDINIMKDKSEMQSYINELMSQGMSEEDALKKAAVQFWVINPLLAGAGGALSGGIMGSGASIGSYNSYNGEADSNINSTQQATTNPAAGYESNIYSPNLNKDTSSYLDKLGKVTGTQIRFAAPSGEGGANGVVIGNLVLVAQDAKNPAQVVAQHEITHRLQKLAPEAYKGFKDYAVSQLTQNSSVEQIAQKYIDRYERAGIKITQDQALDEAAADYAGQLMVDEKTIDRFVKTDRSLAQKFFDSLKELARKIKTVFTGETEIDKAVELWGRALDEASVAEGVETVSGASARYAFKGYDSDTGKGIYESNFPLGTPKAAKSAHILSLIQNVWSKQPIDLVINEPDGSMRTIQAQFDPTYDANPRIRTDASKLMGGNRHGTSGEQRITLDLADDYYQIAAESIYNYSKDEIGKDSVTHEGVKQWHYFINEILFQEYGEKETTPYRVTINVKERDDGSFVYSFNAEKQNERPSTRRTLHADVTPAKNGGGNAQPSNNSILNNSQNSNKKFFVEDELTGDEGKEARFMSVCEENKLSFDEFLEITNLYTELNDSDKKVSQKTVSFISELTKKGYSKTAISQLGEAFLFYSSMSNTGALDDFNTMTASGVSVQNAANVLNRLAELKPPSGKATVQDSQKLRAISDMQLSEPEKLAALEASVDKSTYQRVKLAADYGVSVDTYTAFKESLPKYDSDGNGSYKQDEVTAALRAIKLTAKQKAALWQIQCRGKYNPFDRSVGTKVEDTLDSLKESGGTSGTSSTSGSAFSFLGGGNNSTTKKDTATKPTGGPTFSFMAGK